MSDENPQETLAWVLSHWSTRMKDAVNTPRFLAGNSTTFFSTVLVLRFERSYLRRRLHKVYVTTIQGQSKKKNQKK